MHIGLWALKEPSCVAWICVLCFWFVILLRCGRFPFASQLGWLGPLRHSADIGQTQSGLSLLRRVMSCSLASFLWCCSTRTLCFLQQDNTDKVVIDGSVYSHYFCISKYPHVDGQTKIHRIDRQTWACRTPHAYARVKKFKKNKLPRPLPSIDDESVRLHYFNSSSGPIVDKLWNPFLISKVVQICSG